MSTPSPHYFVFWLGPVQGFIATARRGLDLWFGSQVLAEVSAAAAQAIAQHVGAQSLLSPAMDTPNDDVPGCPNEIHALITADPAEVASTALNAAKAHLQDLADKALQNAELRAGRAGIRIDAESYRTQLDDLLESAWAAHPLDSAANDVSRPRSRAKAMLAAAKSARSFSQPAWSGNRPKSSLDGEREAVVEVRNASQKNTSLRRLLGIRHGEQLCGVGLFKRRGPEVHAGLDRVKSTSHFALHSWVHAAADPDALRDRVEQFLADLSADYQDDAQDINEQVFYRNRLDEAFDTGDARDIEARVRTFVRNAKDAQDIGAKGSPSPYYAILVADGDRMGVAFGETTQPDALRKASKALTDFASEATDLVETFGGQAIYAGGDDVLAFLPTTTAIACADALRTHFLNASKAAFPRVDDPPTLSVGIAIVHHLSPMRASLDAAREAEALAKRRTVGGRSVGRNSFAIIVQKRSGAPQKHADFWEPTAGKPGTGVSAFTGLVDYSRPGQGIPRGLPYDIVSAAARLGPQSSAALQEAVCRGVMRQKRSCEGKAQDAVIDTVKAFGTHEASQRLVIARALAGLLEDA